VLAHVAAIVRDVETAPIDEPTRALLRFARQLTRYDPPPTPADLDTLRAHGFSDRDIHDAVQVIGYFNYIVRVADALGVPLDPWLVEFERELNGA
jgi:alkylhydroperoxidase family enzyme